MRDKDLFTRSSSCTKGRHFKIKLVLVTMAITRQCVAFTNSTNVFLLFTQTLRMGIVSVDIFYNLKYVNYINTQLTENCPIL